MAATAKQQRDLQALAQVAQPPQVQKTRVPLLDGGMRTDKTGHDLALNESPLITNLTLIANRLVVDTGYAGFGTLLSGGSFVGTVQVFYQVFNPDGTAVDLLITTKTVYSLNVGFGEWDLVPSGAFYTSTMPVPTNGSSINLSSTTGLAAGDQLGLPCETGEQIQVTITGVGGTNVTFQPAIPSPHNIPVSSEIVHAYNLNGALDQQVAASAFAAKNWVIFSNGVDPLFYFDGTFLHNLVTGSDLPANTTCSWLTVFHESLVLIATEENGQELPQRVRVSDIGNPQSFKPAAFGGPATSIAAIYDLVDTEDFIKNGSILGPYLILYRETTIMRGTYLGLLNNLIFWEYMIYGEGVRSQGSVAELGSSHEIVGNGGIYEFTGDYSLTSTGDQIFVNFLSAVGDLNPTAQNTLFTQYQQDFDENWIIYPAGMNLLPNKMLRHSMEKGGWFQRVFANEFVSASPYLAIQSTTWATATGTWAQQTTQWNSRIFLANLSTLIMCAPDVNKVFVYDYKHADDAGVPIQWTVQTKDIGDGNVNQRWDEIRISGRGTVQSVQFSLDQGQTFTDLGPLQLGTTGQFAFLTLQAVSAYIRVQLTGVDPTFQLDWLEVWYQEESEY